jgi:Na+/proline symporter
MQLTAVDWSIVGLVLAVILAVGFYVARRASGSSADTPNLVAGLVRTGGVAANWVWWCFLITGMLTGFVYAKLWRRLGVTTDIEFYERRYCGKPAAFLRGFRAIYLGLFFNIVIMANVTLAAIKFGNVLFNVSPEAIVIGAGVVTVTLSAAGGLLGVLITDLLLFVLSMTGAVIAAWFALDHVDVGGLAALTSHPDVVAKMSMLPDLTDPNQYIPLLLIPLAVQWWSVWYPGSEPGGGGYMAQRMLAAKDERHASGAAIFFNFCHYALRPWPWIIVALASIIIFPNLAVLHDALPHVDESILRDDLAYPAMLTFVPSGLLGLVVASLIAAYVSTISTHLNWGASYVVNDVYVRFVKRDATPARQVLAGRLTTVALMVAACTLALALESAVQGFRLLLSIGAGTGLLFFLRWFWSRINAWSEISAMIISFVVSVGLEFFGPDGIADWQRFVLSVAITTAGWVSVTLLTPATDPDTIDSFRSEVAGDNGESGLDRRSVKRGVIAALFATAAVYGLLFGTGYLLYGQPAKALIGVVVAAIGLVVTFRNIRSIRVGAHS